MELRKEIKEELEKNRHCYGQTKILFFLSEGFKLLKKIIDMFEIQGKG